MDATIATLDTCTLAPVLRHINGFLADASEPDGGELRLFLDDGPGGEALEIDLLVDPFLGLFIAAWVSDGLEISLTLTAEDGEPPCSEHPAILVNLARGARMQPLVSEDGTVTWKNLVPRDFVNDQLKLQLWSCPR
jgi:hypothetical protein